LPSRTVTVHGKEKITAVFCSTPPHLASGETEYDDISKIKLDTMLGSKASETVSLGDYVTFQAKPCLLSGDAVTGRSFDDRAGVACLLKIAEELSGAELPVNVAFLLSDGEELGMRGAVTAAFNAEPNEAVAVDVSFGNGIGISPEECGKLGAGALPPRLTAVFPQGLFYWRKITALNIKPRLWAEEPALMRTLYRFRVRALRPAPCLYRFAICIPRQRF